MSPRIDRYSHCTGTITLFDAVSALMVIRPSDGGVSMQMKSCAPRIGANAFCNERSRPIWVDIAISAPARSIELQATSISRLRMTSRIETRFTSTSYIDSSSESGSMPWLMVRFDCGSRSTHSTRLPFSAKATARFKVVVVFATPPFWLANEITMAFGPATAAASEVPCEAACGAAGALITDEGDGGNAGGLELFRSNRPIRGSVFGCVDGFPSRQTLGFRDRQGWRRQDDGRCVPRSGSCRARKAGDRLRGCGRGQLAR